MNNRKPSHNNTARKIRIKELSQEIASLTEELDDLLIEELTNTAKAKFKIGDTVLITNNHCGL
jgi:hypothetical protein